MSQQSRVQSFDDALAQRLKWARERLGRSVRRNHAVGSGPLIGVCSSQSAYRISWKALECHSAILGRSGQGKTELTIAVATQAMLAGRNVLILDAKGDATDRLLRVAIALGRQPEDVTVVAPGSKDERVVPVNYLEVFPGWEPGAVARTALGGLKQFFGDTGPSPWLDAYGILTLAVLAGAPTGCTLNEVVPFTSAVDPTFRNAVLDLVADALPDPIYHQKFAELAAMGDYDVALRLSALENRGALVRLSPATRICMGAAKTGIPWQRIMTRPGQVVLVDLGQSPSLSPAESRIIGQAIIHQLVAWMWSRRQSEETGRPPVHVFIDEAERFTDESVSQCYEKARSLGVHLWSAFQHTEQMRKESEAVAAGILGDSTVRICFNVGLADAEWGAKELFSSAFDPMAEKHRLSQTKFRPVEETRLVTSHGFASSESWSEGRSSGSGHGSSSTYQPGRAPDGREVDSFSSSSAESFAEGWSTSQSSTTAETPFVAAEEFTEVSSITYFGGDDQTRLALRQLLSQGVGECTIAVGGEQPVRVKVVRPVTPNVHPEQVAAFREASLQIHGRLRSDIEEELTGRVSRTIAAARALRGESARALAPSAVLDAEIIESLAGPVPGLGGVA